ncbi:prepilin-type N-terminal cleavage/methylation domain-containing protein [Maribacter sp. 2-571]|uniref:prepilin-type N-terminal cleavage/methylation domain-containing protein n=1 Tax=Maribacter sp. 2-571 TaxID=3417569 RepID=UPI003D34EF91
MENSPKKIPGFTLSEMMVVLVITLIVVGLAFSVLRLVQRQITGIGQNYATNSEINRFKQALWVDFQTYPTLYFSEKDQTLTCGNPLAAKTYRFQKEWIIREKDTFAISTDQLFFFRDGATILEGAIDAMELKTIESQGAKIIFVHQTNAADEYMQ